MTQSKSLQLPEGHAARQWEADAAPDATTMKALGAILIAVGDGAFLQIGQIGPAGSFYASLEHFAATGESVDRLVEAQGPTVAQTLCTLAERLDVADAVAYAKRVAEQLLAEDSADATT